MPIVRSTEQSQFIQLLLETVHRLTKQPNFNVDSEANNLRAQLNNLGSTKQQLLAQQRMAQTQQAMQSMSQTLKIQQDLANEIARNLR